MPAAFTDQSPSPTFSIWTLGAAGAGAACATFAGTGSDTAALGVTSVMVISSVSKPSCFSTMRLGNLMPP